MKKSGYAMGTHRIFKGALKTKKRSVGFFNPYAYRRLRQHSREGSASKWRKWHVQELTNREKKHEGRGINESIYLTEEEKYKVEKNKRKS